jgi:hypothetical protein
MIELMKPKLSFAQSEIQDGDVICFQVDLPDKEYARSLFSRIAPLILQQDSRSGQSRTVLKSRPVL